MYHWLVRFALRSVIRWTHVKLLRGLAQSCVVLLDKVPADLILGQVAVVGGGGKLLNSDLFLVLLSEAAVGSHGDMCVQ